jgi:large subunit ribosomal protein L25
MERVRLTVRRKGGSGKGYNNRLRAQGLIPAIFYGHGEENIPLEVKRREFMKALSTEAGENVIIDLEILDGKKREVKTAILKEKQVHPIRREVLHADFYHISLKEKLTTAVPINLVGEAPGVKMGGILEHFLWEVEIRSLPTKIPDHITADISSLEIGESLRIGDLEEVEGIEILGDPDQIVLTIAPPKVEKEEEELAPKEEEPEVITKRKEEGEGEGKG